ncbi:hypothetical protein CRUP_004102 [Coryphaenoides rupestris]|nr:hypothetical protein CRUP_004102 [Coryphaenoides rupestris]
MDSADSDSGSAGLRKALVSQGELQQRANTTAILRAKLANPHVPPKHQVQITLINFSVTIVGVEEQLLGQKGQVAKDPERTAAYFTEINQLVEFGYVRRVPLSL